MCKLIINIDQRYLGKRGYAIISYATMIIDCQDSLIFRFIFYYNRFMIATSLAVCEYLPLPQPQPTMQLGHQEVL